MSQEQKDFEYFRDVQLHSIDFEIGLINAKRQGSTLVYYNIGSLNPDGYERVWCNGKLRMKHRLIYFLYYGEIPTKGYEIDHYDKIRNNNAISNLSIVTKSQNNSKCNNRKFTHFPKSTIYLICVDLANTTLSDQTIADKHHVSRATVRDIKTRRSRTKISSNYSWEHRGY